MSTDRQTMLRVLNDGRTRPQPHYRSAFGVGVVTGLVLGAVSGCVVGLALHPTIIAALERIL